MTWQNAALGLAGFIGIGVAVIHGVLVHRLMVKPLKALFLVDDRLQPPLRRLTAPLLQFSTFNWFIGGLALIAAANGSEPDVRLATGLLVGSSYLFGAVCNLWSTRRPHPGWILYALALVLIGLGLSVGAIE
ncbi:MAG TPA: hypothetical protein VF686_03040 [Brevundimonas sp.]|jgi:hypothetical protein